MDLWLQTLLIMLAGLIGCIIPAMPGPPLVFLGVLYYSWRTDWQEVGVLPLAVIFIVMLIGASSNLWLSYLGARKTGASVWGSVAAFFGGLIGLIVFSLPGMIIGALAGIAAVEFSQKKDWQTVLKAGTGYLVGYLLSAFVEVFACCIMIGLFFLAVRF